MPKYSSHEQRAYVISLQYGGCVRLSYCEDCGAAILDERAEAKHNLFHQNIDSMVEIMGKTLNILENLTEKVIK